MMPNKGQKMYIVGLTGGIASGKSTVSHYLRQLGAAIIDADVIAREVVTVKAEGWYKIRATFGDEYFLPDGALDRKKLGQLVFANPEKLTELNAILHPLIHHRILELLEEYRESSNCSLVVIDAALLIECGWEDVVDEIWLVIATEASQTERLMSRNHLTKEEALLRIGSQMSQRDKGKFAHRIIDNSGKIEDTYKQVRNLVESIIASMGESNGG